MTAHTPAPWASDDYRRSTTTGACVPGGLPWDRRDIGAIVAALDCGMPIDAPEMLPIGGGRNVLAARGLFETGREA